MGSNHECWTNLTLWYVPALIKEWKLWCAKLCPFETIILESSMPVYWYDHNRASCIWTMHYTMVKGKKENRNRNNESPKCAWAYVMLSVDKISVLTGSTCRCAIDTKCRMNWMMFYQFIIHLVIIMDWSTDIYMDRTIYEFMSDTDRMPRIDG